jgi:hypothetical protein
MAMPMGVDVPQVGHRAAPGCRLSPQVEQRIVFAGESLIFNFGPYEPRSGKIQATERDLPTRYE